MFCILIVCADVPRVRRFDVQLTGNFFVDGTTVPAIKIFIGTLIKFLRVYVGTVCNVTSAELCKFSFGTRMPVRCRRCVPFFCLVQIHFNTVTALITASQSILRQNISVGCSLQIKLHGATFVFRAAMPAVKIIFGIFVTLFCLRWCQKFERNFFAESLRLFGYR